MPKEELPRLMPITREGINLIKRWSPNGVCEIGSGDGQWLRALNNEGVSALGYDIVFDSQNVRRGDHIEASRHKERTLLIIWPPDGDEVQKWIASWRGDTIILGIKKARVSFGTCLDCFHTQEEMIIKGGRKGATSLSVNTRIFPCSH